MNSFPTMRKFFLFALLFSALFSCIEEDGKKQNKQGWQYTTDVDKMDGSTSYFASVVSTNKVNFKFPYNGGSNFLLAIRNMKNKTEVLLKVSNGQFMPSNPFSLETCRVKFDNEYPINFSYNNTADFSSEVIFFREPQKLISNLKTANKLMIECPFFQEGMKIIEFNVQGLIWNR